MAFRTLPLPWLPCLCAVAAVVLLGPPAAAADPAKGFTAVSLSESNFVLQKPYDLPSDARYRFRGGVRQLWVLPSAKPHTPQSNTKPRTEIRITGYDYSSGVWQFEGYGYVPSGTTGVSIMQVFGGGESATTLMLHVYDGELRYYSQRVVEGNIYDRWFQLNVVHDVDASRLTVFIDGVERLRVPGRGGDSHYFKFGVYTQHDASSYMESRWNNIMILRK
ncbi:LOW QUALITY PROTEIN: citrate-binding protein-like [Panicum hallii]|uniref:LOW QUALITY PROTEIN: citrate-binding protein-like n=1 Tax=Panicum hallii TaxID=206008 RepID=UPI000DF4EF6B|nr:LOW QUALITY PROTEIN: citrate-binding protein-like [Panicum hallii]